MTIRYLDEPPRPRPKRTAPWVGALVAITVFGGFALVAPDPAPAPPEPPPQHNYDPAVIGPILP